MRALNDSIEKWRKVAYHGERDNGGDNCPLCQFNKMCNNCIINRVTGSKHCKDTPYIDWNKHHSSEHCTYSYRKCTCEQCTEFAIEEYNFLSNLKSKCKVSTYKSILEPFAMFIRNLFYL